MRSEVCTIHISTHALTEGDGASLSWITEAWYFNSRPHGGRQHPSADGQSDRNFNSRPHGGRHHRSGHDYDRVEFQLTPSRRATREYIAVSTFATYFNSRPHGGRQLDLFGRLKSGNFNSRPHGGRQQGGPFIIFSHSISTHALTEGDRSSVRKMPLQPLCISTHALTEGDRRADAAEHEHLDFNSRPHGGRHSRSLKKMVIFSFQLTPSRRATARYVYVTEQGDISTHALTEGDLTAAGLSQLNSSFQLTPSRRATTDSFSERRRDDISTHALTEGDRRSISASRHRSAISTHALTEGDPNRKLHEPGREISTHALTEGDGVDILSELQEKLFQLTPSRRATMTLLATRERLIFQLTPSRRATANLDKFFF